MINSISNHQHMSLKQYKHNLKKNSEFGLLKRTAQSDLHA